MEKIKSRNRSSKINNTTMLQLSNSTHMVVKMMTLFTNSKIITITAIKSISAKKKLKMTKTSPWSCTQATLSTNSRPPASTKTRTHQPCKVYHQSIWLLTKRVCRGRALLRRLTECPGNRLLPAKAAVAPIKMRNKLLKLRNCPIFGRKLRKRLLRNRQQHISAVIQRMTCLEIENRLRRYKTQRLRRKNNIFSL